MLPIYGIGAAWLAVYIPLNRVFAAGVLPFLPSDLLKIGAVAVIGMALPATIVRFRGKA